MDQHVIRQRTTASRVCATACASFGSALLLWGISPAVVERVVTGGLPGWAVFAQGAGTALLGLAFCGLARLVLDRVRWALWAAHLLSVGIATLSIAMSMIGITRSLLIFPLVLAAWTTASTWIALHARGGGEISGAAQSARAGRTHAAPR